MSPRFARLYMHIPPRIIDLWIELHHRLHGPPTVQSSQWIEQNGKHP
jgi:hypothetical protein